MNEIISSPFTYAIIVAIAAFIAAIGSYQINKKRNEIAETTKSLVNTADSTMSELKKASIQINTSLEQTKKANQKLDDNKVRIIANLNKTLEAKDATITAQNEIIGQLTGGQSYPKIGIGESCFYILINGKYSIPECEIEIILLKDYLTAPFNVTDNYLKNGIKDGKYFKTLEKLKYPKLWKNGSSISIPFKEDVYNIVMNSQSFGFDIFYVSSFKRWKQEIRFLRFYEDKSDFGIFDKLIEENPSQDEDNNVKTKILIMQISDKFPTEFIEAKTKKKFCHIDLYNIENPNLQMYQPNFVMEMTDDNMKLPVYNEKDFNQK